MTAPTLAELLDRVEVARLPVAFAASSGPTVKGRYLHWDELRRRQPPGDLNYDEWWFEL